MAINTEYILTEEEMIAIINKFNYLPTSAFGTGGRGNTFEKGGGI